MIMFNEAVRWESVPERFSSAPVEEARRRIDAFFALPEEERAQTDVPPAWKLPIGEDVGAALRVLSADRCAFCEQVIATKPYRFRPPANARPCETASDRWSYLWWAFDWGNFYLICGGCRPLHQTHFPVDVAREAPHGLADAPLANKAEEHSIFYHPGEFLAPSTAFAVRGERLEGKTTRSRETIAFFHLNRPDLGAARTAAQNAHLQALSKR
jgi:hypothetical protein